MGQPDVDGMLEGLTSRQVAEWQAFSAVEPFGEDRADYRVAYALAVIVSLLKGKDGPPVSVADFFPRVGVLEDDEEADGEEDTPPKHPNVLLFEQMMGIA
jgi:hypothetical protein